MRPSRQENLMEIATVVAKRGTCSRAQVGAVFARDGRVLITGYNGAPSGADHCNHECNCMTPDDLETGEVPHIDWCTTFKPCYIAVHAEMNAIAWAARCGVDLRRANLFVTMAPCLVCAQLLVNLDLAAITYLNAYRVTDGVDLLVRQGIEVHDWSTPA